jgi:hypothetical protein
MKTGFVFFFVLTSGFLAAQDAVFQAIGQGDVATITQYLAEQVELAVGDTDGSVNKVQASAKLKEFYSSHTAKGFRSMHSGASKTNESKYSIGTLATDKGNYRVYVYFIQSGDQRLIQELRIEKED